MSAIDEKHGGREEYKNIQKCLLIIEYIRLSNVTKRFIIYECVMRFGRRIDQLTYTVL